MGLVCSAISDQVVHLPPVMKVTPVSGLVEIRWLGLGSARWP